MENDSENAANAGKAIVSVTAELMRAAGDSPDVKEAAKNLGKAAVVVSQTINTCLLPLAAVNFAVEKARNYFNGAFQQELARKAADIPLENVVEPKASIAGPVLQALAFSHEEPTLRDMYLNLLRSAMDSRVSKAAHPAFVEVIKQLRADEAGLLNGVLVNQGVAMIELSSQIPGERGKKTISRHVAPLTDLKIGKPVVNPDFAAMVDNWHRLGLVQVVYGTYFTDEGRYAWIEERPEVMKFRAKNKPEDVLLVIERGIMSPTDFGSMFARVVGLRRDSAVEPPLPPIVPPGPQE